MPQRTYRIIRHDNPRAFLRRAENWLAAREAEYSLLLGLARRLSISEDGFDPPLFFATIESDAGVEGCAFRTPPHKLGLTAVPDEAIPTLAAVVRDVYDALPAVLGPEPAVGAFAEAWAREKAVDAHPGMSQRIYRLEVVNPLQLDIDGGMRVAKRSDLPLISRWIQRFTEDVGMPTRRPRELSELLLGEEALVVWEDGGLKAMAGTQYPTEHGIRISYVYTPDEYRNRGFATALVHALSDRELRAGRTFCVLYTDLSNPASNSVYRKIGYKPIADVRDYTFLPRGRE